MTAPIEVTCTELKAKLDAGESLVLVDCREPAEHDIVHLPEASLVPMATIPSRVSEIAADLETQVVIHCHHGMRSLQAAQWLRENGVPQAQSLAGGIDAWAEQIDPSLPRY